MKKQPLRVGFDLDGDLLYNPIRIARPIVSFVKIFFLKKKRLRFYYPKTRLEKELWRLVHKSSIYLAPGIDDIRHLVKEKKIVAYIVTARYSFLGKELMDWVKKQKLDLVFSEIHFNKNDEQPHEFKEKMINTLKLDLFVEDNFDIVKHTKKKTKASIVWIYNIFDRGIQYPYKFPYLKKAVEHIKREISKHK